MGESLRNLALSVPVSVFLAFFVNRMTAGNLGEKGAAIAAPFAEEISKTVPAVLFHCPIAAAHVAFGVIESVYDLSRSGRRGVAAAAASLGGHAVVGIATSVVLTFTRSLALALLAGIGLHLGWNMLVTGGIGSGAKGNR